MPYQAQGGYERLQTVHTMVSGVCTHDKRLLSSFVLRDLGAETTTAAYKKIAFGHLALHRGRRVEKHVPANQSKHLLQPVQSQAV